MPEIYQLKVTLNETSPPIWRRLLVPGNFTLEQLHFVLQLAMGWENSHLHEFQIDRRRFSDPELNDGDSSSPSAGDERKVRVYSVLGQVGAQAIYTYDFGDSWEHAILVEKVLPIEPGRDYPACVAGKRRAPPEDCGGIPGFYNFLEATGDPAHPEHADMCAWIGGDFDPAAFSLDDVNKKLSSAFKARRR